MRFSPPEQTIDLGGKQMGVRKFTDQQEKLICARYLAGENGPKLAKEFGCTGRTIALIVRRHGYEMRKHVEITKEVGRQIFDLYVDQRQPVRVVSKKLGICRDRINKFLNQKKASRGAACRSSELAGKRYGRLTVLSRNPQKYKTGLQKHHWLCRCDCGNETTVNQSGLFAGTTKSCGCLQRELSGERMRVDIAGQTFGLLTALEFVSRTSAQKAKWRCLCECGNEAVVVAGKLLNGHTKSCGCIKSGEDSITNLLDHRFRARNSNCEFYIHTLLHHAGFVKPGITTTGKRADDREYGDKLFAVEGDREAMWLLEQGVLRQTRLLSECPKQLRDANWHGWTEVRRMDPDALIRIATELHEELLNLGRWEFAARYVPMTQDQREECLKRADALVAA
jgi:hypothetical protein